MIEEETEPRPAWCPGLGAPSAFELKKWMEGVEEYMLSKVPHEMGGGPVQAFFRAALSCRHDVPHEVSIAIMAEMMWMFRHTGQVRNAVEYIEMTKKWRDRERQEQP